MSSSSVSTNMEGSVYEEVTPLAAPVDLVPPPDKEDPGGTQFTDIQNVIKEKIFSYLEPDDLQIVRTVCRNWYYLINGKFGIRAVIDNRNTELANTSWIVSVMFTSLTRPLPSTGVKFGPRLRNLHFRGIVVSYNLIPLLQSSPHLNFLTFDDPTCDLPLDVMRTLTPSDLSLPECQSLDLLCWNFTDSLNTILSILTLIKFGNLKHIHLRSVHPPMLPLVLLFVPAPRPLDPNLSPLMTLILLNLATLEELSVGTLIAQNKLRFVPGSGEQEGRTLQLEELELVNLFVSWTPILERQRSLRHLHIGHFQAQQWGEVRDCIRRCEATLVRIDLQGRSFGVPWECDIFQNCRRLEQLFLNLTLSPKRFLATLPVTLTELGIDGPIDLLEMANLLQLTALRKLLFYSLGLNLLVLFPGHGEDAEENTDQVSLRLFADFILNLTALETLSFKDCSQDALDWPRINEFCRKLVLDDARVTFHDHFYDMHGQRIQHGLTLRLPAALERQPIADLARSFSDQAPPNPEGGTGIIGTVLRIFGI